MVGWAASAALFYWDALFTPISAEGVKAMVTDGDKLAAMVMDAPVIDLLIYDNLLHRQEGCV
ncbi:hypothetical protein GTA51_19875 [Desulfovibrio aerotolerans]|uniref:Uncharacterized protein n=1 Tax=Solidesulfovibrio aerotolerans TaxID=295255 RepID=A0A7C9MXI2_9BACT|nr:hypothetical protein [Solidesulfovibrio aerotolerans]MYL85354.1 hypothetical protein [Solidesulfovibrio aerotolerans]